MVGSVRTDTDGIHGCKNVVRNENGELICLDPGREGEVVGVVYDYGWGGSPSLTRREYFRQFQPGYQQVREDLRARLRLLRLEHTMQQFTTDQLVDYVLNSFLEPIRHVDPVRAQQLKVEAMQEVRNILARVDDAYPALIVYAAYAVLSEMGVYIPDSKLQQLLRKVYEQEGEVPRESKRRAKKTLVSLGYNLVLNVQAAVRLYGELLGLSNIAISRALRQALRITARGYPIAVVARALTDAGADLARLAQLLDTPIETLQKLLQKTDMKTETEDEPSLGENLGAKRCTIAEGPRSAMVLHALPQFRAEQDLEIGLVVWRNGVVYLIWTPHVDPREVKALDVEVRVDCKVAHLRLRPIKVNRRVVLGCYITDAELCESLWRYYQERGLVPARILAIVPVSSQQ